VRFEKRGNQISEVDTEAEVVRVIVDEAKIGNRLFIRSEEIEL